MAKKAGLFLIGMILMISIAVVPATALADGSGIFKVSRTMYVDGIELQSGQYQVKWEANDPGADVTFRINGKVAAKVRGRIVERDTKSGYDALEVEKESSGNEAIKALRFRGKTTSIVFD